MAHGDMDVFGIAVSHILLIAGTLIFTMSFWLFLLMMHGDYEVSVTHDGQHQVWTHRSYDSAVDHYEQLRRAHPTASVTCDCTTLHMLLPTIVTRDPR
jgi:hypothetical protein